MSSHRATFQVLPQVLLQSGRRRLTLAGRRRPLRPSDQSPMLMFLASEIGTHGCSEFGGLLQMLADFCLPFPISVNAIWTSGRRGTYRSARYKEWILRAYDSVHGLPLGPPTTERVRVTLTFHGATRRSYDIDNHAKAVGDFLESSGVVENDDQIDQMFLLRGQIEPGNGFVRVQVEEIFGNLPPAEAV